MYGKKNCNLRTLSREYDCLANIGTKEAFMSLLGNLKMSKGDMRRLETIKEKKRKKRRRKKNKKGKKKEEDKTHLFLADFGCNR